jgi:hypothetical protein
MTKFGEQMAVDRWRSSFLKKRVFRGNLGKVAKIATVCHTPLPCEAIRCNEMKPIF